MRRAATSSLFWRRADSREATREEADRIAAKANLQATLLLVETSDWEVEAFLREMFCSRMDESCPEEFRMESEEEEEDASDSSPSSWIVVLDLLGFVDPAGANEGLMEER
jgi:hypothetical protein